MIGKLLGLGNAARDIGQAVGGVAEVFVGNQAARDTADQERFQRSLAQFGEEFARPGGTWFDGLVNGLNRLPRPLMAIGTLGLFTYAMVDPAGFSVRMQGLAFVPEPLWWLLGAIVSFYFGARELHHYRGRKLDLPAPLSSRTPEAVTTPTPSPTSAPTPEPAAPPAPANEAVPPQPAPAQKAKAAPARSNASAVDPTLNAAFEEWRAANG